MSDRIIVGEPQDISEFLCDTCLTKWESVPDLVIMLDASDNEGGFFCRRCIERIRFLSIK
jgi:hypothetical protein